jgi:uncharacterized protein (DUF427 family)
MVVTTLLADCPDLAGFTDLRRWRGSHAASAELTQERPVHSQKGTHVKAIIDGAVVAEAPESDLITIEGNYYFPPSSITAGALSDSPTPYTCPWKGAAQYHDISVDGAAHHDAAWSYPDPYPSSFDRVGKNYGGYIAFDKQQVTIA